MIREKNREGLEKERKKVGQREEMIKIRGREEEEEEMRSQKSRPTLPVIVPTHRKKK